MNRQAVARFQAEEARFLLRKSGRGPIRKTDDRTEHLRTVQREALKVLEQKTEE